MLNMLVNKKVSIITPSFNCEKFIAQTIEAIQAQTYQDWEMLITDDCSNDKSVSIIEHYAQSDHRIKLFQLDKNSGAGVARNNSIKEADGRYIAFCDSDDRWVPTKLEKQISFMESRNCAFCYSSYWMCDEKGKIYGVVNSRERETLFSNMCDDKIGCLTAIYDTEKVGKVYMPLIRKRQDWALKLNVLKICKEAFGIQEPLAIYRISSNSLSRKKAALISFNAAALRNVFGWSKVKSYLFVYFVFIPNYLLKRFKIWYTNRKLQSEGYFEKLEI